MKRNLRPSTTDGARTVLGIDPGTLVTGYGIVTRRGDKLRLMTCGTITNRSDVPMPLRLHKIYQELQTLVKKHAPDEVAIESAFYGKNVQSALKLGHARGVSLLAAVEENLPTAEYSPREVKQAVVGKGNATKEQVRFMVSAILSTPSENMMLDASDALAVAICHCHRSTRSGSRQKDWKAFIEAHPERVRA
jgi:crossover junction endodeoxyribonuclease RuvC